MSSYSSSILSGLVPIYYARIYGAKGDGSTNDVSAINAAITAANSAGGGIVQLPAGTCVVGVSSISLKSNVHLRGAGIGATVLQLQASYSGSTIQSTSTIDSAGISDLTIDGGDYQPAFANASITFGSTVTNVFVRRVHIKKSGPAGIVLQGVTGYVIEDCKIEKTTAVNTPSDGILVTNTSENSFGIIRNNRISGFNIQVSGHDTLISKNFIGPFLYGGGITIAQDDFTYRNVISDNIVGDSSGTDSDSTNPVGIENWGPFSSITGNVVYSNSGSGIYNGAEYVTVTGNVAYDNGVTNNAPGLYCQWSSSGTTSFNGAGNYSTWANNSSFNTNGASGTQNYGIDVNTSVVGVIIGVNNLLTNKLGSYGPGVVLAQASNSSPGYVLTDSVGTWAALDGSSKKYTLAQNATQAVVAGAGILILTDNSIDGSTAVFITGGGTVVLISQSGTSWAQSSSPTDWGVYISGGAVLIKNGNATTRIFSGLFLKSRDSL